MRLLWDLERTRKGCVISIYKLQNVLPYCLIKQVNKILGIRNSEIWFFDDVSKNWREKINWLFLCKFSVNVRQGWHVILTLLIAQNFPFPYSRSHAINFVICVEFCYLSFTISIKKREIIINNSNNIILLLLFKALFQIYWRTAIRWGWSENRLGQAV